MMSTHTFSRDGVAVLLLVVVAVTVVIAEPCLDTSKPVPCTNCDFSDTQDLATIKSYGDIKKLAGGWEGQAFLTRSGNSVWNPNVTPDGTPFVGLFCTGRQLARKFTGLTPGKQHTLSFLAAERHGYGAEELMSVRANGQTIAQAFSPLGVWHRHHYRFTADQAGEAYLEWINVSPGTCITAHKTVFFTSVRIHPVRDCGVGAGCHEPLPPSTDFTCRCEGGNSVGKAVVGGKATCTKQDALPEKVAQVEGQVNTIEKSVQGLVDKVSGLQDAIGKADMMADTQADLQENTTTSIADLKSIQGQINTRMGRIEEQLTALLTALKAGAGSIPSGALDVPKEPSGSSQGSPSIVAEGGGIDLQLQSGRHATVNGAVLLTAEEVTQMITDALAGTLQTVGGALE